jgi:hypothetical protein
VNEHEAFDKQLSRAWEAMSPPAGLEAKVRARLLSAGSSAADTAGAASRAPSGAAARFRALRASGAVGAGAAVVLLGLGFIAGYFTRPPSVEPVPTPPAPISTGSGQPPNRAAPAAPAPEAPSSAPAAARAPEMDAPASVAAPAPVASTERDAARHAPSRPTNTERGSTAQRASRGGTRAPSAANAANAANDELVLLERAERAVRAHNPDLALVLTGELEDRYPASPLHEERRAIELMARCQAGSSLALELGERFARLYPGSVYGERIANECDPAPTNRSALDIDGSEGDNNAKPENP